MGFPVVSVVRFLAIVYPGKMSGGEALAGMDTNAFMSIYDKYFAPTL
jgi:hypothetical protein